MALCAEMFFPSVKSKKVGGLPSGLYFFVSLFQICQILARKFCLLPNVFNWNAEKILIKVFVLRENPRIFGKCGYLSKTPSEVGKKTGESDR